MEIYVLSIEMLAAFKHIPSLKIIILLNVRQENISKLLIF